MLGTLDLAVGNLSDRRSQLFAVSTSYPDQAKSTDLYSCWKQTRQPGAPWTYHWQRWISEFPDGGAPCSARIGRSHGENPFFQVTDKSYAVSPPPSADHPVKSGEERHSNSLSPWGLSASRGGNHV